MARRQVQTERLIMAFTHQEVWNQVKGMPIDEAAMAAVEAGRWARVITNPAARALILEVLIRTRKGAKGHPLLRSKAGQLHRKLTEDGGVHE